MNYKHTVSADITLQRKIQSTLLKVCSELLFEARYPYSIEGSSILKIIRALEEVKLVLKREKLAQKRDSIKEGSMRK